MRPVEEVARYLAGGRPVEVVQPPSTKEWDLKVVVPVPDLAELRAADRRPVRRGIRPGTAGLDLAARRGAHRRPRGRAHLDPRLLQQPPPRRAPHDPAQRDLGGAHRGGRRRPHRRGAGCRARGPAALSRSPAQVMAQSGASTGAPAVLARAHHGSVSKEQRASIEEELKAGRLPAVVATSSLELGIDMGAVDLVVQVESPPSVASGLQRVGRAGHQVGAVSRGVLFPKFRGDLVQTAVVVERMLRRQDRGAARARQPARRPRPAGRRDVRPRRVDRRRRARPGPPLGPLRDAHPRPSSSRCSTCSPAATPATSSPSCAPASPGTASSDTLTGRRGAQRLAVTSGGTIPDRGLYAVFLATGEGPGRRVGELDEEMVYESRVGDLFTLGTSTWRIEDITHDRVLVTPAPGLPGRLPFWKGDSLGRPAELGRAVGAFVREVEALTPDAARERVMAAGLDDWAADNLLSLPARAARGHRPRARRPHHRRRAVPRRARRLAGRHPLAVRRARCTPRGPWR